MKTPYEIKWIEGDLPDVHSVPYKCRYLAWVVYDLTYEYAKMLNATGHTDMTAEEMILTLNGKLAYITMAMPHMDSSNPLRWCDRSMMPIGYMEKVTYYAVVKDG